MGSDVGRSSVTKAARVAAGFPPSGWCGRLAVGLVLAALGVSGCAAPAEPPRAAPAAAPTTTTASSTASAGGVATAPPAPLQASINVPSLGVNHLVYFLGKERGLYAAEGVEMEIQ